VSKSSLHSHFKSPEIRTEVTGPKPKLSQEDEMEIVDWVSGSIRRGAPRCSLDVIDAANKVIDSNFGEQEHPVGRGWLQRFNKRHNLVFRVPEKLNRASANITRTNVEGWFDTVSSHINSCPELFEAMQDPQRVCNADETMVRLNSSSSRIIAPKGSFNLFNVVKDDKAGLTVMFTIRADGSMFKPFIIYPYERIPESVKLSFPHEDASLEATKNGWQDSFISSYAIVIANLVH
jgi:hypothetical protein